MPVFRRLFFFFFTALILLFVSARSANAIYNPLSVPNNSFGIHIANTQDLPDAAQLVNSSGGDWGYITLVISQTERDVGRWQQVFDTMRQLHLIPIVRIATTSDGPNWQKPAPDDINGWVSFLSSLNWVVKNRYVTIGNEVNLGKEWGGEVNPEEYATYLKTFTQKLKEQSGDFFILPAGFDASLPTSKKSLEEAAYLRRMLIKEPDVFELVDGWASHSYPNPNFSGSEKDSGRGSIKTYDWELDYLKSLGVRKNLPVFITETGWTSQNNSLNTKYEYAFTNVWNDPRVVAVTPFILNYEFPPFNTFSWKKDGTYGSLYVAMQNYVKKAGAPIQEEHGEITRIFVPYINFSESAFPGILFVTNSGQSIWTNKSLGVADLIGHNLTVKNTSYAELEPGSSGLIFFEGKTPKEGGTYKQSLFLTKDEKTISNSAGFKVLVIATFKYRLQELYQNLTRALKIWHPDR